MGVVGPKIIFSDPDPDPTFDWLLKVTDPVSDPVVKFLLCTKHTITRIFAMHYARCF
jgi:hypothetical protein